MSEFVGSKYAETRDLDIREIAKLVRADIKAAVKAGSLPLGTKASVRIQRYAGGQSLNPTITECPGLMIPNPERVRHDIDHPHEHTRLPLLSPAAAAVKAVVQGIMDAYNYDDSDSMTDYFNVRFYGHAEFCTALERRSREEIAERFETEAMEIEVAVRFAHGFRSIGFEIERQESLRRIAKDEARRQAEKKARRDAANREGERRAAAAEAARAGGLGACEPVDYVGRPRIAWIEVESESPKLHKRTFGTLDELAAEMRTVAQERINAGKSGGYHKTWLVVTWDDGETGKARYDVSESDTTKIDLAGYLLRMWSQADSAKALEISRERVVA